MNTCGHPDRKHNAHGKCAACYARWRYATDPEYRATQAEMKRTEGYRERARRTRSERKTQPF